MLEIREEIWHLLMEHNCVIVPNFGAFVGNYKSAKINKLNHKIYPPSKQVTFNPKLSHNDGLLISYCAQKFSLSYQKAEEVCKKQVEILKQNLQQEKTLQFINVGKVFKDSLGNTRFEPSNKFNLLADAFGLEEIIAFPHKIKLQEPAEFKHTQTLEKPKEQEIKEITKVTPLFTLNLNRKNITAAAAVLIFILYSFYLSFQTNLLRGGIFHMSELNPFSSKVCEVYSPRSSAAPTVVLPNQALTTIPDSSNYISFSLFNEDETFLAGEEKIVRLNSVQPAKVDSTKVVLSVNSKVYKPYQIVVGCFADKANAENLVISLRNEGYLNAALIDYWRGLYRVRIDAFENKEQALAKLPAIKERKNPGAWIIRK